MKRKIFFGVILSIMFAFMMPLFAGCFGPKELPKFMVTWRNDDGTVICQKEYQIGEIPEYTEELPTSALEQNNVETTWKFVCWRGEGGYDVRVGEEYYPIDYDLWFTAEYEPESTHFSFCFKNYDGEVLQNVGEICYHDKFVDNLQLAPKKPAQGNLIYVFKGWDVDFDEFWANDCQNYTDGTVKDVNAVFVELDTTQTTDGVQFTLNNEETAYWVSEYNGQAKDVVIASTHNNLPVEGITNNAFNNNNHIKNVYICEGIKYINSYAFCNCENMKYISLPNSLERINDFSIAYCNVRELCDGQFSYLGNEENPYLAVMNIYQYSQSYTFNENSKVLADRLFENDSTVKNLVIPNGIKNIPERLAYNSSSLESVTIPASVTEIGGDAFAYCSNLKTVTIQGNIEKMGNWAFLECTKLEEINLKGEIEEIGGSAFGNCSKLTTVNIDGSVKKLGGSAFSNCTKLTTVNITGFVEIIGDNAFGGCISLVNISFNEGLKTIESNAFYDCQKLKNISIPNSIENISSYAFNNCPLLTYTKIGEQCFLGNSDNPYLVFYKFNSSTNTVRVKPTTKLYIEKFNRTFDNLYFDGTLLEWYDYAINITKEAHLGNAYSFYINNEKLEGEIVIPNTVTEIAPFTFKNQDITSIVIPTSVTKIGDNAFNNCDLLDNVTIPTSVTTIGSSAFAYCSSLQNIDIPNSVTIIGSNCFEHCSSLNNVVLPNQLEVLSSSMFYYCTALENITIPSSVKTIEGQVFDNCTSLTNVVFPNAVETLGDYMFYGCSNLKLVLIPASVTKIGYTFVFNSSSDVKVYYSGTEEQWNNIEIHQFNNAKLQDRIIIPTLSNMQTGITNDNYTLNYNSVNYDIEDGKIKLGNVIYVYNGLNDYVGYTLTPNDNKVSFVETGVLSEQDMLELRNILKNNFFDADFTLEIIDNSLVYISNDEITIDGKVISKRVIKFNNDSYNFVVTLDNVEKEIEVNNIGQNSFYTPTDNEITLYFLGLDYFNNFTQINIVNMEQGGYNFGSRVDYKLDSNKVYLKQTSYYPSTSVQEMYLSQVGDSYYVYQNNNNSWARYSISEEQFKQNNSNGLSGDTRMLLFDGNNYQNQGDYYLYVGDAVYIDYGNERIPFENITLTINGENLVISFTIGGGVMTGTYTFSNVNTTKVEIPTI